MVEHLNCPSVKPREVDKQDEKNSRRGQLMGQTAQRLFNLL